jgi:quercetin dioxygenase-like cupin family protein
VHTDSVHRHFNDGGETAKALVMKAKSTWMFFGLIQQGHSGAIEDEERFGPREDWGRIWTDGVDERKKVVKPSDTVWETTRDGKVRVLCSKDTPDVRVFSVDVYEQEIPPGSRSAKHWHMADEVAYLISGRGESLQWEVEAEIAERYHARIAKEPTRHEFKADDTLYVPQNHVHQYVNTGDEPLRLLVCQNRLIKFLGYDKVQYLEDAPEFAGAGAETVGAAAR